MRKIFSSIILLLLSGFFNLAFSNCTYQYYSNVVHYTCSDSMESYSIYSFMDYPGGVSNNCFSASSSDGNSYSICPADGFDNSHLSPKTCSDGSSIPPLNTCPSIVNCPDGSTAPSYPQCPPMICWDGSSVPLDQNGNATCPPSTNPNLSGFCNDGSQPINGQCPVLPSVNCSDGSTAPSYPECLPVTCWDGSTAPLDYDGNDTCPDGYPSSGPVCPDGSPAIPVGPGVYGCYIPDSGIPNPDPNIPNCSINVSEPCYSGDCPPFYHDSDPYTPGPQCVKTPIGGFPDPNYTPPEPNGNPTGPIGGGTPSPSPNPSPTPTPNPLPTPTPVPSPGSGNVDLGPVVSAIDGLNSDTSSYFDNLMGYMGSLTADLKGYIKKLYDHFISMFDLENGVRSANKSLEILDYNMSNELYNSVSFINDTTNPYSDLVSVYDWLPQLPSPVCSGGIHTTIFGRNFDFDPCLKLQPLREVLAWVFSFLAAFNIFNMIFRSAITDHGH